MGFIVDTANCYFAYTYRSNTLCEVFRVSKFIFVVIGLGLLSAIGLGSYILASRYLPLIIFGLLGYLEPVLLALVSLLLGEKLVRKSG